YRDPAEDHLLKRPGVTFLFEPRPAESDAPRWLQSVLLHPSHSKVGAVHPTRENEPMVHHRQSTGEVVGNGAQDPERHLSIVDPYGRQAIVMARSGRDARAHRHSNPDSEADIRE